MTYGCHNRDKFEKLIPLPAVYNIDYEGHAVVCDAHQLIPNVFKRSCQYTLSKLGQQDKGCIGCKHREIVEEGRTVG